MASAFLCPFKETFAYSKVINVFCFPLEAFIVLPFTFVTVIQLELILCVTEVGVRIPVCLFFSTCSFTAVVIHFDV